MSHHKDFPYFIFSFSSENDFKSVSILTFDRRIDKCNYTLRPDLPSVDLWPLLVVIQLRQFKTEGQYVFICSRSQQFNEADW